MTGNPAVCLPAGELDGIPVGVQLIGERFDDLCLLAAAEKIAPGLIAAPQGLNGGGNQGGL